MLAFSDKRNENHNLCDYLGPHKGREYLNTDNVVFGNTIRGDPYDTNNPIQLRFQTWNVSLITLVYGMQFIIVAVFQPQL